MEAEARREEARKASSRVDFVSSRTTPPAAASTAGGLSAASIVAQAKVTASGKRSKWDTAPAKR